MKSIVVGGGGGVGGPSSLTRTASSSNGSEIDVGSRSGGGIPTIVTSLSTETSLSDDFTIAKEFENFRLNNASQAQGRRFSVFNKAFDPESSSQGSSDVSEGGIKVLF